MLKNENFLYNYIMGGKKNIDMERKKNKDCDGWNER